MASKKVVPGETAKTVSVKTLHGIKVGESLTQNVEGHPPRADSPEFTKARATLHKILTVIPNFFGTGDGDAAVQAHHGGSIWVYTGDQNKWMMVLNVVGVEWNEQFAADPAKIDLLRQTAKRIVDAFPGTREALKAVGYDPDPVLDTPVTDGAGIGRYVDSLFNSCVPLPQKVHTGTVSTLDAASAGIHNYPVPAWGMLFIHRANFQPFVPIGKGSKAVVHVAPVSHDPSDKRVRVLGVHGDDRHALHKKHLAAEASGKAVVLAYHDPIAMKAHGGV